MTAEWVFEQCNHNWLLLGRESPGEGMVVDIGRVVNELPVSWLSQEGTGLSTSV